MVLKLFLFCLPYIIFSEIITDCSNDIIPTVGDTIICDNRCVTCNIKCDNDNQCKSPTQIYSAALSTSIDCSGANSCQDTPMYIGIPPSYPTGYDIINFQREQYTSIEVSCDGSVSCSKAKVYINGNFINGGSLNADGGGSDHFKDAYLQVQLQSDQVFNLDCGTNPSNCGGNTNYICNNGICQCNNIYHGQQEGCSGLNSFILASASPTQAPDTPSPTTKPFDTPTKPTLTPTAPTYGPLPAPTLKPTSITSSPTSKPTTLSPTGKPSRTPTATPTKNTNLPTFATRPPSNSPSTPPTFTPTDISLTPTSITISPTSNSPTTSPSITPTLSTTSPSLKTDSPTIPTVTETPSISPTITSDTPTVTPSDITTQPSEAPTAESSSPTFTPSDTSSSPSVDPTYNPTNPPTSPTPSPIIPTLRYKPGYKAGIIVSTSIIALALVILGVYYLMQNSRKKHESEDDVKALDSALPMSVPWKTESENKEEKRRKNMQNTSDIVREHSTNDDISDIRIVANDMDTAGMQDLL